MTIAVVTVVVVTFFSKKNFTPPKPMRFLRAAFRDLVMFYRKVTRLNIPRYDWRVDEPLSPAHEPSLPDKAKLQLVKMFNLETILLNTT